MIFLSGMKEMLDNIVKVPLFPNNPQDLQFRQNTQISEGNKVPHGAPYHWSEFVASFCSFVAARDERGTLDNCLCCVDPERQLYVFLVNLKNNNNI